MTTELDTTTTQRIEGRVPCDATAASCRCDKPNGHVEAGDPVHACDPKVCTGTWSGTYDQARLDGGRDWQPLTLPKAVAR